MFKTSANELKLAATDAQVPSSTSNKVARSIILFLESHERRHNWALKLNYSRYIKTIMLEFETIKLIFVIRSLWLWARNLISSNVGQCIKLKSNSSFKTKFPATAGDYWIIDKRQDSIQDNTQIIGFGMYRLHGHKSVRVPKISRGGHFSDTMILGLITDVPKFFFINLN